MSKISYSKWADKLNKHLDISLVSTKDNEIEDNIFLKKTKMGYQNLSDIIQAKNFFYETPFNFETPEKNENFYTKVSNLKTEEKKLKFELFDNMKEEETLKSFINYFYNSNNNNVTSDKDGNGQITLTSLMPFYKAFFKKTKRIQDNMISLVLTQNEYERLQGYDKSSLFKKEYNKEFGKLIFKIKLYENEISIIILKQKEFEENKDYYNLIPVYSSGYIRKEQLKTDKNTYKGYITTKEFIKFKQMPIKNYEIYLETHELYKKFLFYINSTTLKDDDIKEVFPELKEEKNLKKSIKEKIKYKTELIYDVNDIFRKDENYHLVVDLNFASRLTSVEGSFIKEVSQYSFSTEKIIGYFKKDGDKLLRYLNGKDYLDLYSKQLEINDYLREIVKKLESFFVKKEHLQKDKEILNENLNFHNELQLHSKYKALKKYYSDNPIII